MQRRRFLRGLAAIGGSTVCVCSNRSTANDEDTRIPARPERLSMKTMGGRQFWGDVHFFRGWRIQENVVTGHFRLLDPADQRHASGSLKTCRESLDRIRKEQTLPSMSGRAVILVHGIIRSSKSFAGMALALNRDGATVVGFDYPSTRVSIPQAAQYLHRVIESLEGITRIDLVVHSMGGLVLRSYLQKHRDPRIRRAVMLGVPNQGAEIADVFRKNSLFKAFYGPAGQQLISDGDALISKLPIPGFEFGIVAGGRGDNRGFNPLLPGDNDSTVTVASARLTGARDFIIRPVMHSFLMSDSGVIDLTRHFLEHGQFDKGREPQPITAEATP